MSHAPGEAMTEERIRGWRAAANNKAAREAGFAYEAYVRLKLAAVRSFLARLVMDIRGTHPRAPFGRAIAEVVDAWALCAGVNFAPADEAPPSSGDTPKLPAW